MKIQMKIIKKIISTFAVFLMFAANSAFAEEGAIRLANKAMKQVIAINDKGEREVSFVEPTTVIPGDVILYTIEFENISNEEAANIVIDDPVPNNSLYRDGSAAGENAEIMFSLDGKKFDVAENLFVEDNGAKRLASAKDYRSVRWIIKQALKPGEKKTVSFKTEIKKPGDQ
jgi:uncharacterized repeat protein (TIGR01451 family)